MICSQECGGKLNDLETKLKEAEKAEAIIAATCKTTKTNVAAEEKKFKQLEKSLAEVSLSLD